MKDLQTVIGELRRLQHEARTRYPFREMGVLGGRARGSASGEARSKRPRHGAAGHRGSSSLARTFFFVAA